jgi:hypothetical protein
LFWDQHVVWNFEVVLVKANDVVVAGLSSFVAIEAVVDLKVKQTEARLSERRTATCFDLGNASKAQ